MSARAMNATDVGHKVVSPEEWVKARTELLAIKSFLERRK